MDGWLPEDFRVVQEEPLGKGRMGAAYRAVRGSEEEPVVVWELAAPSPVGRMRRELLGQIDDPTLAMVQVDGACAWMPELLPLESAEGPLERETVIAGFRALALALGALHDLGLVHGAVHAGNILALDDSLLLAGIEPGPSEWLEPEDDVAALAALAAACLEEQDPIRARLVEFTAPSPLGPEGTASRLAQALGAERVPSEFEAPGVVVLTGPGRHAVLRSRLAAVRRAGTPVVELAHGPNTLQGVHGFVMSRLDGMERSSLVGLHNDLGASWLAAMDQPASAALEWAAFRNYLDSLIESGPRVLVLRDVEDTTGPERGLGLVEALEAAGVSELSVMATCDAEAASSEVKDALARIDPTIEHCLEEPEKADLPDLGEHKRWRDLLHLGALGNGWLPASLWGALCVGELAGLPFERVGAMVRASEPFRIAAAESLVDRPDQTYLMRRMARAWHRLARRADLKAAALVAGDFARRAGDHEVVAAAVVAAMWARQVQRDGLVARAIAVLEGAEGAPGTVGELLAGERSGDMERLAWAHAAFVEGGSMQAAAEALVALISLGEEGETDGLEPAGLAKVHVARLERALDSGAEVKHDVRALIKLQPQLGHLDACRLDVVLAKVLMSTGKLADAARRIDDAVGPLMKAGPEHGLPALLVGSEISLRKGELDEAREEATVAAASARAAGLFSVQAKALLLRASILDRPPEDALADLKLLGATPLSWEDQLERALVAGDISLRAGDAAACHTHANTAAELLADHEGHAAWADYRLLVSAMLAAREDYAQTWQWLWSASEQGLSRPSPRRARQLSLIAKIASEHSWGNVLRVAAKLGGQHWLAMGEGERAKHMRGLLDAALQR